MKKIKFIVVAGSSGGHIFPALKYLNNLSNIKKPNEVLFITNEVGVNYLSKIRSNEINKLIVNSKNKFTYILKIFLNLFLLFIFNRKITLIGFGGFITTPVLIIAKLFNIFLLSSNKIFIHEQNFIYGLANKINYIIAKNVFISFPKINMQSKEILVGNFFLDKKKSKQKFHDEFLKVLLMGGSSGSLDLNNKMLAEIKMLNKDHLDKIKFFIQIPDSYLEIYKKKYLDIIDIDKCIFFSFENNLNPHEYGLILSRSGSGSINEILYYTNNVFFIPHLISRDQHQKYNLSFFSSHNMSLKKFSLPKKKNFVSQYYFNSLINPHSIEKIICYTTR